MGKGKVAGGKKYGKVAQNLNWKRGGETGEEELILSGSLELVKLCRFMRGKYLTLL